MMSRPVKRSLRKNRPIASQERFQEIANQGLLQHNPSSAEAATRAPGGSCRCAGLTQLMVVVSSPLLMTRKNSSYRGQRGGLECFLTKWEQSRGYVVILLSRGSCWSAAYMSHSFAKLFAECHWFVVAGLHKEVCREGKHGSIDRFCSGAMEVFLERRPDIHKDKVKLVDPPFVGRGVCHGLFHVAVKALTHTIRPLVVGRYPDSLGT